jgi:hypothetical protein
LLTIDYPARLILVIIDQRKMQITDSACLVALNAFRRLKCDPRVKRHDQCVKHERVWALEVVPYRFYMRQHLGTLIARNRALFLTMYARDGRDLWQALAVDRERV